MLRKHELLQVHKAKLRRHKYSKQQRKQAAAYTQHMVAPGDDIGSIARANNVLLADIERLNIGGHCTAFAPSDPAHGDY